jgi:3',5'-cyclic AMP phosphodiesterase CpdA
MQASFVQVSDLHFGQEDGQALDLAAQVIAERKPDAVIVSGDLTALGSEREMRNAFVWLRALPAPVLATPGNHDTPYFDLLPRLFDPFRSFRKNSEGIHTDAWINERFVIVPINTARGIQWRKNWALGAISMAQVRHACEILSGAPPSAAKIVVTHHPLAWPTRAPIAGDTRGGPHALEKLIEAGADLFLSGHLHQSAVELIEQKGRSAHLVSAGTLSIRHRGEPASFLYIERSAEGVWSFERMSVGESGDLRVEQAPAEPIIPALV